MFKLPDLPFAADALAPTMSADTLNTHHGKHHAAYVKKTNDALKERTDAPNTMEDVVRLAARERDKGLFNNSAQAWNHAFFWNCLSPQKQDGPNGALKAAIEKQFGSVSGFIDEAKSRGAGHFASGWLWLVTDRTGAVQLVDLHDADTPIVDPAVTPLFTADLWEHAYYLDYKNDRPGFLTAYFDKLINWRFAESQYEARESGGWTYPT